MTKCRNQSLWLAAYYPQSKARQDYTIIS